jgi:hypothetical protein
MAIVKLETGEELEFDNSYSDEQISQAVDEYLGQKQPVQQPMQQENKQPKQEGSALGNFARGLPVGLGRAATGFVQAATDLGENAANRAERAIYGDEPMQKETFGSRLAGQVQRQNQQLAQEPLSTRFGTGVGEVLPYLATGAGTGRAVSQAIGGGLGRVAGLGAAGAVGGATQQGLSAQEQAGLDNRLGKAAEGGAYGAAFGAGLGALGEGAKAIYKPISKGTTAIVDRVKSEFGNKEIAKQLATTQLRQGLEKEGIDIAEALKQTSQEGKDLVDILDPRFATLNKGLRNLNRPETIKIADKSLARINDTTNKLQSKVVNLVSERKITPDQAGEILGRNSKKIFSEALQARRAKAAPLYRKGLESGTKVDLNTVLTENTPEISDLLGVEGKELTLKNLLNSPVIKNSISQARAKSLEFAKSPAEDIYGKIYQKTKPVYKTITERKDIISNPISQRTEGFYSPMLRNVDLGAAARDIIPEYSTKTILAKPAQYKIPDNDIRVLHAVDNILYDRINEIAQTGATKEQTALGIVRKSISNLLDNSNDDLAKARRLWRKDTENLAFAKNSLIGKYAKYYKEGRTDELAKAAMNVLDLPTNKIIKARQINPQEFSELLRSSIENKIASIQPLDEGVVNPKAFTKAFFSDNGKNLEAATGDKEIVKGFRRLAENLDIRFQRNRITKAAMESQAKSVRVPTGKSSALNRVLEFAEDRIVSSPAAQKEFVNGLFTPQGQEMLKTIANSEKKVQEQIINNFMKETILLNLSSKSAVSPSEANANELNMSEDEIRQEMQQMNDINRNSKLPPAYSGEEIANNPSKIKQRYYR